MWQHIADHNNTTIINNKILLTFFKKLPIPCTPLSDEASDCSQKSTNPTITKYNIINKTKAPKYYKEQRTLFIAASIHNNYAYKNQQNILMKCSEHLFNINFEVAVIESRQFIQCGRNVRKMNIGFACYRSTRSSSYRS